MSWGGQILTVFKPMVVPLAQGNGEICIAQVILQPISLKSDRLPDFNKTIARDESSRLLSADDYWSCFFVSASFAIVTFDLARTCASVARISCCVTACEMRVRVVCSLASSNAGASFTFATCINTNPPPGFSVPT